MSDFQDNYQNNLNDRWELVPKDFAITAKTFPYVFHYDYDKYKLYENSNKIVASKILLFELSKYENLQYPIHVTIEDSYLKSGTSKGSTIFTIMDFSEDIDSIYMPNNFYQNIDSEKLTETDNTVKFNIINEKLEKATKITLKPFKSSFYRIPNPKQYLEIHLKRNYTVLKKKQIISLIFKDSFLDFDIVSLSGKNDNDSDNEIDNIDKFYSIIDTELEVEFEKSYDYIEQISYPKPQSQPPSVKKDDSDFGTNSDKSNGIKERFPGKGNRLGD